VKHQKHNFTSCVTIICYTGCHYAECRILLSLMNYVTRHNDTFAKCQVALMLSVAIKHYNEMSIMVRLIKLQIVTLITSL